MRAYVAIEGGSGGEECDVDDGDTRRTGIASFVFVRARLPLLRLDEGVAEYCGQDEGDNDEGIEGEEEQPEDRARW